MASRLSCTARADVRAGRIVLHTSDHASTFLHPIEHGLDVDDRCVVEGLHVEDLELDRAQYFGNFHPMKSDRIGPILRAGAEDTSKWSTQIVAGMYAQSLPMAAIQPGQDQNLFSGPEICQPFLEFRLKFQPSLW